MSYQLLRSYFKGDDSVVQTSMTSWLWPHTGCFVLPCVNRCPDTSPISCLSISKDRSAFTQSLDWWCAASCRKVFMRCVIRVRISSITTTTHWRSQPVRSCAWSTAAEWGRGGCGSSPVQDSWSPARWDHSTRRGESPGTQVSWVRLMDRVRSTAVSALEQEKAAAQQVAYQSRSFISRRRPRAPCCPAPIFVNKRVWELKASCGNSWAWLVTWAWQIQLC